MTKATSVTPGRSPARGRKSAGAKAASTERKADKVVESARQDATRVRVEAEEHARRIIVDARATADGVRAEGMEVVSNLRQISDTLRELADRVLEDVEAIHARMVGELEQVAPEGSSEAADEPVVEPEDELDVPEFVQQH